CCTCALPFATKPRTATPAIANPFNKLFIMLFSRSACRGCASSVTQRQTCSTHADSFEFSSTILLGCILTAIQGSRYGVVPCRGHILIPSHHPSFFLSRALDQLSLASSDTMKRKASRTGGIIQCLCGLLLMAALMRDSAQAQNADLSLSFSNAPAAAS